MPSFCPFCISFVYRSFYPVTFGGREKPSVCIILEGSARSRCVRTFSSDLFSLVAKRENGRGNFSFLFNDPLPCCLGPLFISRLAFRSGLSEFNRDQCVVARQYCEIIISSAVEVIPSKTKFCCWTNKPWGWGNFPRVIACT